jgi:hypothetical protein
VFASTANSFDELGGPADMGILEACNGDRVASASFSCSKSGANMLSVGVPFLGVGAGAGAAIIHTQTHGAYVNSVTGHPGAF